MFASDGAEPQWGALAAIESRLPANRTGDTMRLVDAFHVAEYVQKAANAIDGIDSGHAKVRAATWREMIKRNKRWGSVGPSSDASTACSGARDQLRPRTSRRYYLYRPSTCPRSHAVRRGPAAPLPHRHRHHGSRGQDHRRHSNETRGRPLLSARGANHYALPSRAALPSFRISPSRTACHLRQARARSGLIMPRVDVHPTPQDKRETPTASFARGGRTESIWNMGSGRRAALHRLRSRSTVLRFVNSSSAQVTNKYCNCETPQKDISKRLVQTKSRPR